MKYIQKLKETYISTAASDKTWEPLIFISLSAYQVYLPQRISFQIICSLCSIWILSAKLNVSSFTQWLILHEFFLQPKVNPNNQFKLSTRKCRSTCHHERQVRLWKPWEIGYDQCKFFIICPHVNQALRTYCQEPPFVFFTIFMDFFKFQAWNNQCCAYATQHSNFQMCLCWIASRCFHVYIICHYNY